MTSGHSWKRTLAILAVLVLALVLVSLVAGGKLSKSASGPVGTIFVSSTADAHASFLETLAVDLASGAQNRIGEDAESVGNFYNFSHDGRSVAFIGMTKARLDAAAAHQASVGSVMQVYRATLTDEPALPQPAKATQITDNDTSFKSSPAISDDGVQVLYVAASSSQAAATSSMIHLVSNGADTPLVEGIRPIWYSDTVFYYIAADGIRRFDTSSSESAIVIPTIGQNNFKIAVSPDRALLAFANPDAKNVYFYRLSVDGKLLTPVSTVKLEGFWVVFSPDSKYAAIQTAAGDGAGAAHPALILVDTGTFQTAGTVPLDPLLNDRLFVTAWQ